MISSGCNVINVKIVILTLITRKFSDNHANLLFFFSSKYTYQGSPEPEKVPEPSGVAALLGTASMLGWYRRQCYSSN